MSSAVGDEPDTALARRLHDGGALDQPTLKRCLDEVRGRRERGEEASLALLLVERQLVAPRALDDATRALDPSVTLPSGPDLSSSDSTIMARRTLGPYRLERAIARGGMGAVYEAVHQETGARFALKTLLPSNMLGVLDPESVGRLRREAKVLSRLDHPGIVRVHEANVETHPYYLVMDLLSGGSLRDRLKAEGQLEVADAVKTTIDLAYALQYAHDEEVLHRDLKPGNVLFDAEGKPMLVDFGLARVVDASLRLTATGQIVGTPAYMPPEHALAGETVGPLADVYGLGALLYAMLTGRHPFKGDGMFQVLEAVLHQPPEPPSRIREGIPPAVEAVCLRALAKVPQERHATPERFAEALEAAWAGGEVAALKKPFPWTLAAIASLCGLALLVLLVVSLGGGGTPSKSTAPPSPETTPTSEAAPEPEGYDIGWRLEAGQEMRYRFTWEEGPVESLEPTLSTLFEMKQRATKVTPESITLQATVLRVRVVAPKMLPPVLDSDDVRPGERGAGGDIAGLVGQEFQVEIDPATGKSEVSGFPPLPGVLGEMFGKDSPNILLTTGMNSVNQGVPNRPVAVGETWEVLDKHITQAGVAGWGTLVCTLEEVNERGAKVTFRMRDVDWQPIQTQSYLLEVKRSQTVGMILWRDGRLIEADVVTEVYLEGRRGSRVVVTAGPLRGSLRVQLVPPRN